MPSRCDPIAFRSRFVDACFGAFDQRKGTSTQLSTTVDNGGAVRPMNRSTAPDGPDNVPGCQAARITRSLVRSGCAAVRSPGRAWSAPLASPPGHNGQAVEEVGVEAYVPAQHPSSCPQARLSRPDEHPRRARRAQEPARQGPRPSLGLTNRIRERDAFERLRRDGTRIHSTSLWCNFLSDPVTTPTSTAFAIGRAVGPAVVRNRLRRRLRALLLARQRADPLPPGSLLIGVRPGVTELTFDQLRSELEILLDRLVRCL